MSYPTFQGLMDAAYATWTDDRPYDDFLFGLPPQQRMAVLLGNLNYQVENGGFAQWFSNDYGEHANDVRYVLQKIGTDTAAQVNKLVTQACMARERYGDALEGRDLDDVDTAYYQINEQLMAGVEAFFAVPAPAQD